MRVSAPHDRSTPLDVLRHVEPSTELLHEKALESLQHWLDECCCGTPIASLVKAPGIIAKLLSEYGQFLYASHKPLYKFIMCITALQRRFEAELAGRLNVAWTTAHNWRLREPVNHRLPVPRPLAKAIIALAYMMGQKRLAGICALSFFGPGHIGECMRASRKALVLPPDMLFEPRDRVILSVVSPKTRNRGGATIQHISFQSAKLAAFLSHVFSELGPEDKLFPFSASTFRNRWDSILARIGLPPKMFLPGGLRGGGAVSYYFDGAAIADLLWKMRIKHAQTLTHYLQEVSAAVSLKDISCGAQTNIKALCGVFDTIVDSLSALG